jgi:hypothetical protein
MFAALLAVIAAKPKYSPKEEAGMGLPDLDITKYGQIVNSGSNVGGSTKKNICQAYDASHLAMFDLKAFNDELH